MHVNYYDPTRSTQLIVDASKYGLASMLTQLDPETGKHKVVRYDSRATITPESRYAQIELESAAVEFAIKRNYIYLYGLTDFTVITDHKPLLALYNSYRADMPQRIHRHKLNLQGYNFKLKHEAGKDNPTNYMSRHTSGTPTTTEQKEHKEAELVDTHVNVIIRDDLPAAVTLEQMRAATAKDPQLQVLTTAVQRGYMHITEKVMLKPYRDVFSELSVVQGLILGGSKLVVLQELRAQVINLAHEGHQGIVRTKQFLRATTWFPGMDKLVEEEIAHCLPCQVTVKSPQQEPLKPTKLPVEPGMFLQPTYMDPLAQANTCWSFNAFIQDIQL